MSVRIPGIFVSEQHFQLCKIFVGIKAPCSKFLDLEECACEYWNLKLSTKMWNTLIKVNKLPGLKKQIRLGNCDKFYFTFEFKYWMWVWIFQKFEKD
jgi:hypothetical protein